MHKQQTSSSTVGFTGRQRQRKTRTSVKVIDALAKYTICIGGIGVTVAFATIVVFLVSVVVPLFQSPKVEKSFTQPLPVIAETAAKPAAMEIDEHLATLWVLTDQGKLITYRTTGGELVKEQPVGRGPFTAISNRRGTIALGYADGTVQVGTIKSEVSFVSRREMPDAAESLMPGHTMICQTRDTKAVGMMTPSGQMRVIDTRNDLSEPLKIGDEPSPIQLVDYQRTDEFEKLAALRADGRLYFTNVEKKTNLMTGKVTRRTADYELPLPQDLKGRMPIRLLLGLNGTQTYLVYADGTVVRYNTADPSEAKLAEVVDVVPDPSAKVASVEMLIGDHTMIVADDKGNVSGWFPVQRRRADGGPYAEMIRAHELKAQEAAVTAIGTSARDRQFVTGDTEGQLVLRHMTSGTTQATVELEGKSPIALLTMAPKNDAIAVLDAASKLTVFSMDNPYADASLAQLFLPIHYEGYAKKGFVYQSSAGHEGAEVKISMVPLLFGTLKATTYALLFAVPIAIMAAIYTSEFMQPQVRAVVKPTVELMASLPSVVLGFIGALVLAPIIESVVPAVLLTFIGIPIGVAMMGFIWQVLPMPLTRLTPGWLKFGLMIVTVLAGAWACWLIGPVAERVLFGGSIKAWLNGAGSPTPGWAILLAPLIAVGLTLLFNLKLRPRLAIYRSPSRRLIGMMELMRFALLGLLTLGLSLAAGWVLSLAGLDPRGSFIGNYVQRNSLIVGLMMGFAIIPIIYTVSEDALSSVPSSLRSASLGAGATPWQTAVRVVLPVAASGIFSACMIGFGRAAGETMIVLMAAGGTAIMDINIFEGLRALSANIATELPEAARGSTHYRILFLSGLLLFAITFVVNTAAEIVRTRFRKRAYQL